MNKLDKPGRIAVALLLLVLVPGLFYTAYELNSLSTNERLLDEIYTRQLDAILYSVNQHAWDVVNSWANQVTQATMSAGLPAAARQDSSLQAVFFADTSGALRGIAGRRDSAQLADVLRSNREVLSRLARYTQAGYRKLEPLYDNSSGGHETKIILAFATGENAIAGFVIDTDAFVRNVIGPKLLDVARGEFVLAVLSNGRTIMGTEAVAPGELKQQRALWLFPGHMLGIRLKGTTITEVVRERALQSIVFVVILDVVLITGVWFIYRTIRREMELVRLKSDFISNVSHELRTPLALIRMFAETLEMGRVKNDDKKKEYYSTVVKESERLTRLINNILDFSRMEAGRKQYNFSATDINTVVAGVVDTYSYHLQSEGIAPVTRLAPDLPPVKADSEAVMEAIINLLDNAVKYGNSSKFIRLETKAVNGGVAVEVEDHGIGIAPEHQEKIFDTFYRVSGGLVHNTKGSGLGLTLVKHIMHAHGGKVELESTIGKGSTFRLLFPGIQSQSES